MLEEKKGDVQIYRIIGKIDAYTAPYIEKKVVDSIQEGTTKIVLNLGGATYMSSAGVRVFLNAAKKVKEASGRLIICDINTKIWEIMVIAHLNQLIETANSEENALLAMDSK